VYPRLDAQLKARGR